MEPSAGLLGIVLAAGEGTRMKSRLPKVLHKVAGRALVSHAMTSALGAGVERLAVVIGPDRPDVAAEVRATSAEAAVFEQRERRGTAHAVLQAAPTIEAGCTALVVLFGDTPLVRPESIRALAQAVEAPGIGVAVMGFHAVDPTGYGRLIMEGEQLLAIREHKDASETERAITLCNAGLMAIKGAVALDLLRSVRAENAQKEFYLTDCVALAREKGFEARCIVAPEEEALGVNDRVQLAACEGVIQRRLREHHMRNGVTLIAPETVFFALDTRIAPDVIIEPNVFFGPGVEVASGATLRLGSHIEGARIGENAIIGPYARLRPGAVLGEGVLIGNFVEVKQAEVGAGTKISHLTYIGDAVIGIGVNIGAGSVTCNFDGYGKYETRIGDGAFIGSNTAMVAPVKIGAGALIGAGSTLARDVEAEALGLTRPPHVVKPGWAARFRERAKQRRKPE